jgi:hypothetical protein
MSAICSSQRPTCRSRKSGDIRRLKLSTFATRRCQRLEAAGLLTPQWRTLRAAYDLPITGRSFDLSYRVVSCRWTGCRDSSVSARPDNDEMEYVPA